MPDGCETTKPVLGTFLFFRAATESTMKKPTLTVPVYLYILCRVLGRPGGALIAVGILTVYLAPTLESLEISAGVFFVSLMVLVVAIMQLFTYVMPIKCPKCGGPAYTHKEKNKTHYSRVILFRCASCKQIHSTGFYA